MENKRASLEQQIRKLVSVDMKDGLKFRSVYKDVLVSDFSLDQH